MPNNEEFNASFEGSNVWQSVNHRMIQDGTSLKFYEDGNVKDTAEFQTLDGDTKNNVVTFTSQDSANPNSYEDIAVFASGETHESLFGKLSRLTKNVRWIKNRIGDTTISALGSTITKAISKVSQKADSAIDTANSADRKADNMVTIAERAEEKADNAVSIAENAVTTSTEIANSAVSTANSSNAKANNAVQIANNAVDTAQNAVDTSTNIANGAVQTANSAVQTAQNAVSTANGAVNTAQSAVQTANSAVDTVNNFTEDVYKSVNPLGDANVLKPYANTFGQTYKGLSIDIDNNNVMTINGTAESDCYLANANNAQELPKGDYIIKGFSDATSDLFIYFFTMPKNGSWNDRTVFKTVKTNDVRFTITDELSEGYLFTPMVVVKKNVVCNNTKIPIILQYVVNAEGIKSNIALTSDVNGIMDGGVNKVKMPNATQDVNIPFNANTFNVQGYTASSANLPGSGAFDIMTFQRANDLSMQLALNRQYNTAYIRSCVNGTWQPWKRLVTEDDLANKKPTITTIFELTAMTDVTTSNYTEFTLKKAWDEVVNGKPKYDLFQIQLIYSGHIINELMLPYADFKYGMVAPYGSTWLYDYDTLNSSRTIYELYQSASDKIAIRSRNANGTDNKFIKILGLSY